LKDKVANIKGEMELVEEIIKGFDDTTLAGIKR
jgi:hypothetical protein